MKRTIFIIIACVFMFTGCISKSEYLVKAEDDSDVVIIVSNQSLDNPTIKLEGTVDDEVIFRDKYKVEDQRNYLAYYLNVPDGEHEIVVKDNNGNTSEESFTLSKDNEKLWMFISFWDEKDKSSPLLDISIQNKPINLK